MAKRRQSLAEKAGEFELNLTPMIDAVFLLLIFFMTTTVFVKATQLKIELPDSAHYDQLKAEKKLNLRISSEGQLEINGQLVAMGQPNELARAREGPHRLIDADYHCGRRCGTRSYHRRDGNGHHGGRRTDRH